MESRYRPGTIVRARGREWIVLPPREPALVGQEDMIFAADVVAVHAAG